MTTRVASGDLLPRQTLSLSTDQRSLGTITMLERQDPLLLYSPSFSSLALYWQRSLCACLCECVVRFFKRTSGPLTILTCSPIRTSRNNYRIYFYLIFIIIIYLNTYIHMQHNPTQIDYHKRKRNYDEIQSCNQEKNEKLVCPVGLSKPFGNQLYYVAINQSTRKNKTTRTNKTLKSNPVYND